MATEIVTDSRFVSRIEKGGSTLEVIKGGVIIGDEESMVEARIRDLRKTGRRVVDCQLTVDTQLNPPVSGWILHRETTK